MTVGASGARAQAAVAPEEIVGAALRRVLGEAAGQFLRSDTPLWDTHMRVALRSSDAVALVDAVADQAAEAGGVCLISDDDLGDGAMTVGDLVEVVDRRWQGAR